MCHNTGSMAAGYRTPLDLRSENKNITKCKFNMQRMSQEVVVEVGTLGQLDACVGQ